MSDWLKHRMPVMDPMMDISMITLAVCALVFVVSQLRPVRLFFLRRLYERVLREVDAEMLAEYGADGYVPDPARGERLWRQCLRIHGLEEK